MILLLASIPILLVIKFKWEALLPIIIYLQLILIWAQAEIALRQHNLFSTQFEPLFSVRKEIHKIDSVPLSVSLYIRNVSQNPAYNITVTRILAKGHKPIPPVSGKIKFLGIL